MTTCNNIIALLTLLAVGLGFWCLYLDSQNEDMRGYIKRMEGSFDLDRLQREAAIQELHTNGDSIQ